MKLTDFGRATLADRYLLPGEQPEDLFRRVATAYADDTAHAERLYQYMTNLWFMPATPILSSGGAGRGLPISCFLNGVEDSMEGIRDTWNENVSLASNGGGIGTYWGDVRSVGEPAGRAGTTSGVIPFIKVQDSLTLAVSQGNLRRGSAAVYLDIHHPEIEEFLGLRKPTGDANRISLNLHHGVVIDDAFMNAAYAGEQYALRSPKTGMPIRSVDARSLWQKILETRIQTGEPYILWKDTATRAMPHYQRKQGLKVTTSNLCSEIMLAVTAERTAVCCLSSVNAATFLEWKDDPFFIEDLFRFLDNVLEDFIIRAPATMAKAVHSVKRERAVGLGLMGFHSFLQAQGVAFESVMAKSWNMRLFAHLRQHADKASRLLADERGPCLDAQDAGVNERFAYKLAVAPTASISIICGGVSAGIEPIPANVYTHKTLSGSFVVRNPALEKIIGDDEEIWDSILENEGSVQHLDCLDDHQKDVFKTAFELDQRWVIELAADRAPLLCQGQSVNLFLPADIHKVDLHGLHWSAWEKGLKSLYYARSKSIQRAAHVRAPEPKKYEECLACQ
ncbi:MAG: ribonucleoside-diphosphate reductase subunit alpha [Brevundimonas sp.]